MQFSAGQIAEFLQGTVDGDAQVLVHDIAKIEEGRTGTLTFLANPAYTEHLYTTGASVAIVANDFRPTRPLAKSLTLVRVADPRAAFSRLLQMYAAHRSDKFGYEQPHYISPQARIGEGVYIGAFSYIADGADIGDGVRIHPHCYIGEGVRIGAGTVLHPGVRVLARCQVGARCVFHSGVVIGADGFGYTPNADGSLEKMPQIGNVVIEDDVEIGANSTIDRATLGSTFIRKGVKIDNLVQVGHNVEIGAHSVVVAQAGIAGSTKVGANCQIGGQAGIAGHLNVGDRTRIAAQSGIGSHLPPDSLVQGSPAFAKLRYDRSYVLFRKLPDVYRRVDELEKELAALRARSA